jgi:putative transcriptional regulator
MINNLRALRATKGLTQADLGQALGVSRQAIIAIEADQHDPSLDLAFKIAALFETQVEAIFENPHHQT